MLLPPFRTPTPPSVQILCLRFRVLTFKYDLTEAFELYSSRKISTTAIQRSFADSLPTPFFLLSNISSPLSPPISPSSLLSLSIFLEKNSLFELAVIRYRSIQSNSTIYKTSNVTLTELRCENERLTLRRNFFSRKKSNEKYLFKETKDKKEGREEVKYSIEWETRWNSFDRIKRVERSSIRSNQSFKGEGNGTCV